jgi:hypothetical protein
MVHHEYVKERLGTGELEINYMKTTEMLADILTKPLGGQIFHYLAEMLLGKHRYTHSSNRGVKKNIT